MDETEERTIAAVYTDGGVIRKNPSPFGGTWAYVFVDALDELIAERSGAIGSPVEVTCPWTGCLVTKNVGNNLSEFLAVVEAMEALPDGWSGYLYSDSEVTLNRFFGSPPSAWNWLEPDIAERGYKARMRLGEIVPVQLAGHPNRKELAIGHTLRTDKDGNPKPPVAVSRWNVRCDKLAEQAGITFLAELKEGGK